MRFYAEGRQTKQSSTACEVWKEVAVAVFSANPPVQVCWSVLLGVVWGCEPVSGQVARKPPQLESREETS